MNIVNKFIAKQANLQSTDQNFDTALTYACAQLADDSNYRPIALALIKAGARVNHQNELLQTALHLACTHDFEVTKELIAAGAALNIADQSLQTPLFKVVAAMSNSSNLAGVPQRDSLLLPQLLYRKIAMLIDKTNLKGYSARNFAQETHITWAQLPSIKGYL